MSRELANAKKTMLAKQGELGSDTIMTQDRADILLSKKCLTQIANMVSRKVGRGMTHGETQSLITFIQGLPARNYIGLPYARAQNIIADHFISRGVSVMSEDQARTDEMSSEMHEYQKSELHNLTNDENPLKLAAFADRRGNAIIDEDRVHGTHIMADRGSPNDILASQSPTGAMVSAANNMSRAVKTFTEYLNPETIGEILMRNKNSWITYESVVLPHQTTQLDSRFRQFIHTPLYEYRWLLNFSGNIGNSGDIRFQDTLKEVIQMQVSSFWIPCKNINDSYYNKIRMFVKEFAAQSIEFAQYLADGSIYVKNYHFEFLITQRDIGRLYLTPIGDGIYRFRKPFARVESLTISFLNPFEQIIPDLDMMTATVSNTNPAVFTTSASNTLATGDLIYAQLFNSPNPDLNDLVNRQEGYIVTRLSATTFSIPVDLTTLAGPTTGVQVYFGSKRVIVPLRFTSLEQ